VNSRVVLYGAVRGFMKNLLQVAAEDFDDVFDKSKTYNKKTRFSTLKTRVNETRILDFLGFIQKLRYDYDNELPEIIVVMNRFLTLRSKNKKYIIYLENPYALFHYRLNRINFFNRSSINKYLADDHLFKIVCWSHCCEREFKHLLRRERLYVDERKIMTLYPPEKIEKTNVISRSDNLSVLMIVQGPRFLSKSGLEFIRLAELLPRVNFTLVSHYVDVNKYVDVDNIPNLTFQEFNLSFNEVQKLYLEHHLLFHVSRDDSFGLVVYEALRNGMVVIGSNIYAIKEMLYGAYQDNYNIVPVRDALFTHDSINRDVWRNRKLLRTKIIDSEIVDKVKLKIIEYSSDLEMYKEYSEKGRLWVQSRNSNTKWKELLNDAFTHMP